jgi:hypothetical protein
MPSKHRRKATGKQKRDEAHDANANLPQTSFLSLLKRFRIQIYEYVSPSRTTRVLSRNQLVMTASEQQNLPATSPQVRNETANF